MAIFPQAAEDPKLATINHQEALKGIAFSLELYTRGQ
jgi:hypothetical protein